MFLDEAITITPVTLDPRQLTKIVTVSIEKNKKSLLAMTKQLEDKFVEIASEDAEGVFKKKVSKKEFEEIVRKAVKRKNEKIQELIRRKAKEKKLITKEDIELLLSKDIYKEMLDAYADSIKYTAKIFDVKTIDMNKLQQIVYNKIRPTLNKTIKNMVERSSMFNESVEYIKEDITDTDFKPSKTTKLLAIRNVIFWTIVCYMIQTAIDYLILKLLLKNVKLKGKKVFEKNVTYFKFLLINKKAYSTIFNIIVDGDGHTVRRVIAAIFFVLHVVSLVYSIAKMFMDIYEIIKM